MPHLIMEHSSNIKKFDYELLFSDYHQILSEYADIESCKSRVLVSENFLVGSGSGSGSGRSGFIHLQLFLMPGRSEAIKAEISEKLLNHTKAVLSSQLKEQNLSASLSVSTEDLQSYHKMILNS